MILHLISKRLGECLSTSYFRESVATGSTVLVEEGKRETRVDQACFHKISPQIQNQTKDSIHFPDLVGQCLWGFVTWLVGWPASCFEIDPSVVVSLRPL